MDDDDDVAAAAPLSKGKSKSIDGGESSREADGALGHGNVVLSAQGTDCSQVLKHTDDVLSTLEINARSIFKVRDRAAVQFRWSMRFPASIKKEDLTAKAPFSKMPYLALGKIKIERAAANDDERESKEDTRAVEFSGLKKQLDGLWTENRWLRKNIEQLRSEIGDRKTAPAISPVESRRKIVA